MTYRAEGGLKEAKKPGLGITEISVTRGFCANIHHPQHLSTHLCPLTCLCLPRLHAPVKRKTDNCVKKKTVAKARGRRPGGSPRLSVTQPVFVCRVAM